MKEPYVAHSNCTVLHVGVDCALICDLGVRGCQIKHKVAPAPPVGACCDTKPRTVEELTAALADALEKLQFWTDEAMTGHEVAEDYAKQIADLKRRLDEAVGLLKQHRQVEPVDGAPNPDYDNMIVRTDAFLAAERKGEK